MCDIANYEEMDEANVGTYHILFLETTGDNFITDDRYMQEASKIMKKKSR